MCFSDFIANFAMPIALPIAFTFSIQIQTGRQGIVKAQCVNVADTRRETNFFLPSFMKTLSNGIVTIGVKDHGAELCSIKCEGREYLWGAYPEYWKRHSPVLFPIVGSVWDGVFRSKGRTYSMGQHGIARDMDFTLLSLSDDEIWYELRSSAETRTRYPYDFILRIGYKLHGHTVDVCWEVENPSDEVLPFQIGAHPAFYWPMLSDEAINEGVGAMERELSADTARGFFKLHIVNEQKADFLPADKRFVFSEQITAKGCVSETEDSCYEVVDDMIPISTDLFDDDALILPDSQVDSVTILDEAQKPYLTVAFTSPLVGLWSPPKKNAPFVCIEPWYGRTDSVGYDGMFEDREHMNLLEPHETFKAQYEITIHR